MTLYEKKMQLAHKQAELEEYKDLLASKKEDKYKILISIFTFLTLLFLALSIFLGIKYGIEWGLLLGLLCVVSFSILIFNAVFDTIYQIRKAKAPGAINKLREEIIVLGNEVNKYKEDLKNQVMGDVKKEIDKPKKVDKVEELDVLIKYKELLDKNIITQEEFDKKKSEILNN